MLKNKITLSIVVPIYNTKQYLVQCLDSLVNQTLHDFELILVDDGSTDGSSEICDQYAALYPCIKLIRQENSGVTQALKAGMAEVTGEYYSFCGSDDFVDKDFYKNLYEAAKRTDADIAQCGYSMFYSNDDIVPIKEEKTASAIERANGIASEVMDVLLLSPSLTVRRIHKTSLTRQYNIDFDSEIRIAEDLLFSCYTLLVSQKVVYVRQEGYFYRQIRDGRLSFLGDERAMDILSVFDKIRGFISKNELKKYMVLAHLEINILLYQKERICKDLHNDYMEQMLHRITLKKCIDYMISGYIFSAKMHFLKYFILNFLCSLILSVVWCCKMIPYLSFRLLNLIALLRKGNFFKRMLKKNICRAS